MRKDIELNQFRQLLEAQMATNRQRLEQEMNSLQAYSDSNPDLLDASTKSFSQERSMEWIKYLRGKQNLLEDAIQRLETGQFGVCARCGKDIEVDRLKAKPYAKYCINCKEKKEKRSW